jgi:hypothetical protein
MPITRELDNLKKLESVGFSHEQAETLADVIEKSHVDSQESLKEFIHNEISGIHKELGNEISGLRSEMKILHSEMKSLRSDIICEMNKELKDLLIKIFGIIVGTVGIAVTILKLFP